MHGRSTVPDTQIGTNPATQIKTRQEMVPNSTGRVYLALAVQSASLN